MNVARSSFPILFRRIPLEDWLTLVFITGALLVVIRSVKAAGWVETPTLEITVVAGTVMGLAAIRLGGRSWRGHLLALLIGIVVVYLQGATLAEAEGFSGKLAELGTRLSTWLRVLVANDISTDVVPFAVALTALTFIGSYFSSWVIFKTGNVWLAILPSAIGLITNLTYLPDRFYTYIFPYLLFAMLLAVHLTTLGRQSLLKRVGMEHPRSLRILSLGYAVGFSSLLLLAITILPREAPQNSRLKEAWNSSRWPVVQAQQQFNRLFPSLASYKEGRLFESFFPIQNFLQLSDEEVFAAIAPYASYWSGRAYTTYTGGGWKTEGTSVESLSPASEADRFTIYPVPLEEEEEVFIPGRFPYRVEVAQDASYLFLPSGVPVDVDLPAKVEAHPEAPSGSDILSIRPKRRLKPGAEYTGSSALELTGAAVLRSIPGELPEWVDDPYLQLPRSLPQRVRDMATSLTLDEPTLYDRALAIESYLRTLEYDKSTEAPPYDADRVDYFLFDSQRGQSDHFSSAMTVMLRAIGIPARLVSGYGPGIPDLERGAFVIRDRDRHSWPEAYFNGAGWIEFEPSPNYALRPRDQSQLIGFGKALALIEPPVSEAVIPPPSAGGIDEDDEEDELDGFVGGRLPGGFGVRPLPLANTGSPLGQGGALFGAALLLWATALWIVWRRRFMALPRPEVAYGRLCRLASFLVAGPTASQTPLEYGSLVANTAPTVRQDINIICQAFSESRYGRGRLTRREGFRVYLAWRRVRRALARRSLN